MIRVLIADNHPIVLHGIKAFLKSNSEIEVVASAVTTTEMFNYLDQNPVDLVLLEMDIPEINGITALRKLKKDHPNVRVLMFSAQPEDVYAISTLRAGASGYLSKKSALTELSDAITKVAHGGSRFFELGWQWKTRLLGKNSDLRFVYGVSYQSNGLKPTNNQYFVKEGDNTTLDVYEGNLDKSKFRLDNLVIPLYLEFSPYKNRVREGFVSRYRNTFVLGVGGYAGLNLSARQKLKFNDESNHSKEKIKDNYNTNNVVYGLGFYIGKGDTSLYVKYDLNTIFKDPNLDQHNVSLGLRFEL